MHEARAGLACEFAALPRPTVASARRIVG